jgi:hypothetical protein
MHVQKILSFLPDELLESLALETNVDYFTKKPYGSVVLKLLLHGILNNTDNSLRMMESTYGSLFFSYANGGNLKEGISFSSISGRLSCINPVFFEKVFIGCVATYKDGIGKDADTMVRFDSTIVALSTKLLKVGYLLKGGDAEKHRQLKFTVGHGGGIPETVLFFTDQRHNSENIALKEAIEEQSKEEKERIKVFDRGITARKTYDDFADNGITFVSRLVTTAKHDTVEPFDASATFPMETATLKITSDDWCQLYAEKGAAKHLVRVIKATRLAGNTTIWFVTNDKELIAVEVSELYKRRWDIEVFFKFIKQLLNFSHLINRSGNGIKVVMYATMIASILLIAYKKLNNLKGFKIMKLRFTTELEEAIVMDLIVLCGGNPEKLMELYPYNTS